MDKKMSLYFCSVLGLISLASADAGWELIKQTKETKIYTRENAGERIKELKVVTKMDATVDELVAVYLDGENHPKWYPACVAAKVVKKTSDSELQVYHKINNPWPVKDRDYVIAVKSTRDGGTGGGNPDRIQGCKGEYHRGRRVRPHEEDPGILEVRPQWGWQDAGNLRTELRSRR
jgi:hypothetical protein